LTVGLGTRPPRFRAILHLFGRVPRLLADWLRGQIFNDRNARLPVGLKLQYHSRSDAHSVKLCELIVDDLLSSCKVIAAQAREGRLVYGINFRWTWPNGKSKTVDLAIGTSARQPAIPTLKSMRRVHRKQEMGRLLIACEAKTTATEHHKSQPRIYSELNDSHTIVHEGDRWAIAAGIELLNIAETFVSPLRQHPGEPIHVTRHNQPAAAANMIAHLRGLPRRLTIDANGLEAMSTIVVEMNNQGRVELWTNPPAPQPGNPDHYEFFLRDLSEAYIERFWDLDNLPEQQGLTLEETLRAIGRRYPGLLTHAGQAMRELGLPGAEELLGALQVIDTQNLPEVNE
jgi:hypothetical protein